MTAAELIEMLKVVPPDTPIRAFHDLSENRARVVKATAWVHAGPGYIRLDSYNEKEYGNWGKPRFITFEEEVTVEAAK